MINKYETGIWIVLFLQCQSPRLPAASAAHFSRKNLLSKDYVPKTEPNEKNQVPGSVSNGVLYSFETATLSQGLPLNSHLLPKDDSCRHLAASAVVSGAPSGQIILAHTIFFTLHHSLWDVLLLDQSSETQIHAALDIEPGKSKETVVIQILYPNDEETKNQRRREMTEWRTSCGFS